MRNRGAKPLVTDESLGATAESQQQVRTASGSSTSASFRKMGV